jgi:hypothetical protein
MALAPYLHLVVWSCKFEPHLSEKYDESVNPVEFLQVYSNSILTVGGNETIMANYFTVDLTGMDRSWLMNLPGVPHLMGGAMSSVHGQHRECIRSMRSTSMPCSIARGSHCGHSSSGSPKFKTPSPASPTLLLLPLFNRA